MARRGEQGGSSEGASKPAQNTFDGRFIIGDDGNVLIPQGVIPPQYAPQPPMPYGGYQQQPGMYPPSPSRITINVESQDLNIIGRLLGAQQSLQAMPPAPQPFNPNMLQPYYPPMQPGVMPPAASPAYYGNEQQQAQQPQQPQQPPHVAETVPVETKPQQDEAPKGTQDEGERNRRIKRRMSGKAIFALSALISGVAVSGSFIQTSNGWREGVEICGDDGMFSIMGNAGCFIEDMSSKFFNPANVLNFSQPEQKDE